MARYARGRTTALAVAALAAGMISTPSASAAQSPTPVQTDGVWGIDFAGGTLNTVERAANGEQYVMSRQVAADGTTVGDRRTMGFAGMYAGGDAHLKRVPCDAGSCVPLNSAGNGNYGVVFVNDGKEYAQIWLGPDSYHGSEPGVTGARIVDITGRYFVYNAASTAKQYVDDVTEYRGTDVRLTRSITAASVWGSRLWTANATAGSVSAYDLEAKKVVETLAVGAPCTVKELQAVGRWLYWNCGPTGAAGVYDRTAKKSIAVPSGPALVSDGYLVRHDRAAAKLLLTDFHTGTAVAPRPIADLPAGNTADQRRLTWSVDKFGGDIAYVGPTGFIHIVPSGVPGQPLAKIESQLDDAILDLSSTSASHAWKSTWQLSRPANWTFTVKDATGRTVRTMTGGPGAEVDVEWDGKTDTGAYTFSGRHTWTLKATAVEGTGTYSTSGSISVGSGRPGLHDQGGYSLGDLVTLNSSGTLTVHLGHEKGNFGTKYSGTGWPAGTVAVPFGDTNGDRCNELLVRTPGGDLRRYKGKCGAAYTPTSTYTKIGTGWGQYDVLTSPGDANGDGRADLITRQASTGDMYFHAGTADGKFNGRVKIGTNWKTYGRIAGVGDITGDGKADLVAHDRSGGLWRYEGVGNGTFKARVQVFKDWGRSYNALVGIGDLNGDGKPDIVARDTAGKLFRNDGNGRGSFGGRSEIATGWQGYKGLF